MTERLYTIGEISRICGIKTSALRYYDRAGVIKPAKIDQTNGYRYYGGDVLLLVPILHAYQDNGFSLREVPLLLAREDIDSVDEAFAQKIDELEREIRKLRTGQQFLAAWRELIAESREADQQPFQTTLRTVPLLPMYRCRPRGFDGMRYENLLVNIDICNEVLGTDCATMGPLFVYFPRGDRRDLSSAELLIRVQPEDTDRDGIELFGDFPAVCCYHRGEFEFVEETCAAMREWAAAAGLALLGDHYERIVIDYWTTTHPRWFLTEVIMPIKK